MSENNIRSDDNSRIKLKIIPKSNKVPTNSLKDYKISEDAIQFEK